MIGALIFSLAKLASGRLSLPTERMPYSIAVAGLGYYASGALMVVLDRDGANLPLLWERAPFLCFLPLLLQLSLTDNRQLRWGLEAGALVGAFGLAAWIVAEIAMWPSALSAFRAQGPLGNSGPLATTAAFLFAINLYAIESGAVRKRVACAVAAFLSALVLALSGMRTLFPALIIVPLLFLAMFPDARRVALRPAPIAVIVAMTALFAAIGGPTIAARVQDLIALATDNRLLPTATDSLGQRIALWECAQGAIADAPLFGLGRASAQEFMAECTLQLTGQALSFSHFHNAVLTAMAFGGIIELVAISTMMLLPIYWVWRTRKVAEAGYGRALILALSVIFGLNGLTNLMLDHDIHDTLFIHATTVGLAMMAHRTPQMRKG